MEQFLQQLVNSLSIGSIYALIALGYTMVYGIIQLINFAHGDVLMLGAYVGYFATTSFHFGFIPSLVLAMAACAVIGVVIERVAYRPLRNSPRITLLITAIGVSLVLEYVMVRLVGPGVRTYPELTGFLGGSFTAGGVTIKNIQIAIVAVSVTLMLLLQFIVKRTSTGKAMRAVSQDAEAARLMGISVDRTISLTFAIGSALAGAAGVLLGVYYNAIQPLMGISYGLKAFIAAVFGGIGLIPGALAGGYAIGLLETVVKGSGFSMYSDGVVYAVLIIVLIVRPAGLLGRNVREKV